MTAGSFASMAAHKSPGAGAGGTPGRQQEPFPPWGGVGTAAVMFMSFLQILMSIDPVLWPCAFVYSRGKQINPIKVAKRPLFCFQSSLCKHCSGVNGAARWAAGTWDGLIVSTEYFNCLCVWPNMSWFSFLCLWLKEDSEASPGIKPSNEAPCRAAGAAARVSEPPSSRVPGRHPRGAEEQEPSARASQLTAQSLQEQGEQTGNPPEQKSHQGKGSRDRETERRES